MAVDLAVSSVATEVAPAEASGGLATLTETPSLPEELEGPSFPEELKAPAFPEEPPLLDSSESESESESASTVAQVEIIEPKKPRPLEKKDHKPSRVKSLLRSVALFFVVAIVLFFLWSWLNPTSTASDLTTGQCVEDFFSTDAEGGIVGLASVSVVDCSRPHAYEVIAVSDSLFPGDEYPGVRESFVVGQTFCLNEYASFIGGGQENLETWDVWTFVPPENQWEDTRLVQCLTGDAQESTLMEGTLRNAAATE